MNKEMISIVMPARNEEGNIPRAYEEITEVFTHIPDYDYEVIVIDNGSTDRTAELVCEICSRDNHWRYVQFSRDFGAEASMTLGMRLVKGDAAINVFSDLQDPPQRIPDFIAKWKEGYDVVCGIIVDRQDQQKIRGLAARVAYRIIRAFSDVRIPVDAGDFRLVSRKVIDAFNKLNERERYVRGLLHWVGFKEGFITYERRPRKWGKSKAPFWWCFQFVLNAVTSFSTKPLKLFTIFGFIVLCISILASLIYGAGRFFTNPPRGVTTTLVLLLWNLAIMSLGIGIMGEYIGHIYAETKRRPLCLVDKVVNVDADTLHQALKELGS